MLSTASAINATLYGASRINYIIAKDGELPAFLERKVWNQPVEGLLVTSALTLVVANLFSLENISMMGSAGFLLVFVAVNVANAIRHRETHSQWLISACGAVACAGALGALLWQRATTAPSTLWVIVVIVAASVAIESSYRRLAGRELQYHS
jgi:amino acid transporter